MAEKPVNLYSTKDLKKTTDDHLPLALNGLGFKQTHLLGDVRLGLNFISAALAGGVYLYDKKVGYDKSFTVTAVSVILYALINVILFFKKELAYEGVKGDLKLHIHTLSPACSQQYKMRLFVKDRSGKCILDKSVQGEFSLWFNSNGFLVLPKLKEFLSSHLEIAKDK